MIKAIIFDCFGVLVTENWLAFRDEHFGSGTRASTEATDLLRQADAGLIRYEDFIDQIAQKTGLSPREVDGQLSQNAPNYPLFEYIRTQLKPRYKIGMLSNAASDWLSELFTPQQLELFDATVLSFEAGASKPDEQAYISIADKLGCQTNESVFVDDQERHCAGARQAGMSAILYKNFGQTRDELEKLV